MFSTFFLLSNSCTSKLQPGRREDGVIPSQSFETLHKASVNYEKGDEGASIFPEMIANTITHRSFLLPKPASSLHVPDGQSLAVVSLYPHVKTNSGGDPKPTTVTGDLSSNPRNSPLEYSIGAEIHPLGAQAITHLFLDISPNHLLPGFRASRRILQYLMKSSRNISARVSKWDGNLSPG